MTPKRFFTDAEEAEIAKIYLAGYTERQIAQAYQLKTHGAINCALRRQGATARQFRYVRHRDSTIFKVIDSEEKAYWLGFLYADGCINKSLIQLSLANKDAHHVKKFADFLGDAPCAIKNSGYKDYLKATTTIYDKEMAIDLGLLGIETGRPDYTKATNAVPDRLLHHFIRGNFDGDGCASNQGPSLIFCGNAPFVTFLRNEISARVGTNPNLKLREHRCGKVVYISFRRRVQALLVADYIYKDATIFLERKKDIVDSWRK
jgi:hypothetical protein